MARSSDVAGDKPGVCAQLQVLPVHSVMLSPLVCPSLQIMNEYQPPSQAASQRAVRSLPKLTVRAKDAAGEPGEGEALARAGEPCSVW